MAIISSRTYIAALACLFCWIVVASTAAEEPRQIEIKIINPNRDTPSSAAPPPSAAQSAGDAGRYKVTVTSIGNDLFKEVFSGLIIKTMACPEPAVMDDAILEWYGATGELLFLNYGMKCMVTGVYR